MKKYTKAFIGIALILGMLVSVSGCLDPANFDGDWTNIDITGDFFFTDVTAGAFVITNLSRTIKVTKMVVEHSEYKEDRVFMDVPEPLSSRAVLVNASEENYKFTIDWLLAGATGENPIVRSLTMPASRLVREYFLFKTAEGEVVLVDTLEDVRQRGYDPNDTVFEFTFIQRDPVIEVIAQQIFESRNSGPLIIRNGSPIDLSGLSVIPKTQQLRSQMTEFELNYVLTWNPTLRPRNAAVLEFPSTGIRVRAGDYIILHDDVEIAEVSVQPEISSHFGITNVVTIIDDLGNGAKPGDDCECGHCKTEGKCECPHGGPKQPGCDEKCKCHVPPLPDCECGHCKDKPDGCDCELGKPKEPNPCDPNCKCYVELVYSINRIDFRTITPWFSTSSDIQPQPVTFTGNLAVGQSLTYFITLSGPGSISQRQETADKRVVTFGAGVSYTEGIARVTKTNNNDAWIRYTIPGQYNGGIPVFIEIKF